MQETLCVVISSLRKRAARLADVIMVKIFDMERIDKEQHWVIDIYKYGVIYSLKDIKVAKKALLVNMKK